jgi:hypothetical protein
MIIKSRSGLEYTGFESEKELLALAFEAKIDPRFSEWKANDRSKAGLLALGKRPEISRSNQPRG